MSSGAATHALDGGFLQFGTPNADNPSSMLGETECKCIFVMPAYRLHLFGFLTCPLLYEASHGTDLVPNLALWDQRMALEWTHAHVGQFGGDATNITAGGFSAGAHSAFYQLAYDLGLPDAKSIIRRAVVLSNGPGLQPTPLADVQVQFDELVQVLGIPASTAPAVLLKKLRAASAKELVLASMRMKYHQFRAVTDDAFVPSSLIQSIHDGRLAQQMKRRGIRLLLGECSDEHSIYGQWRPPRDSISDLFQRLEADYPLAACHSLVRRYYPHRKLPTGVTSWPEAFGRIYADVQIHALQRGMVNALVRHGAGELLYRYRIEWRPQCTYAAAPAEWGVTHGTDLAIWFWGNDSALTADEKTIVQTASHTHFARFVRGDTVDWGVRDPLQMRTLTRKGTVLCQDDARLEWGAAIWETLKKAGMLGQPRSEVGDATTRGRPAQSPSSTSLRPGWKFPM